MLLSNDLCSPRKQVHWKPQGQHGQESWPSWAKGYSISWSLIPTYKLRHQLLLVDGLGISQGVVSNFFYPLFLLYFSCIFFLSSCTTVFFESHFSLIFYYHYHYYYILFYYSITKLFLSELTSFIFFFKYPPHANGAVREEWLHGTWLPAGVKPWHYLRVAQNLAVNTASYAAFVHSLLCSFVRQYPR